MVIRIPYLIQDPRLVEGKDISLPVEFLKFDREPFYLDGPISRRVAVLDFDEATGCLAPGLRFLPKSGERDEGTFELLNPKDFRCNEFRSMNAFTTVLATLTMFEESDALGREVKWAFDGPQLLVIPNAGEWANAFYQRESHSLQFFYFPTQGQGGERIFTALSQEIISHETGHAVLDGIAPDLYHCLTPQSLALHEAVADLTALLLSLRSPRLREKLLKDTGGSVHGSNAYSQLAEEFGSARDRTGRAKGLRNLWNEKTLNPDDETEDDQGRPNRVQRTDPHALSEVLSGALYRVFVRIHEENRSRIAAEDDKSEFSASGEALFVAREHFKRLVLRSLDYLPPGEVSFTDYGRAILASDQASYADRSEGRDALKKQFVDRHIVSDASELEVQTNFVDEDVQKLDLDVLLKSDWVAYEFANRKRDFLGIPPEIGIWVRPRLKAEKTYRTQNGFETVTECIFKVSWDRLENNQAGLRLPPQRQITVGTTLVIDWATKKVRVLLRSQAAAGDAGGPGVPEDGTELRAAQKLQQDRDALLEQLVRTRRLARGAERPVEAQYEIAARVEMSGDLMRVRGSGRMLHIMAVEEEAKDG